MANNVFANMFKIKDLRDRIFFTIIVLAIFRLGSVLTIPGIDPKALTLFRPHGLFRRRRVFKFFGVYARRNTVYFHPDFDAAGYDHFSAIEKSCGRRRRPKTHSGLDADDHGFCNASSIVGRSFVVAQYFRRNNYAKSYPAPVYRDGNGYHRHDDNHLARRADYGKRYRQRYFDADFCRYCSSAAAGRLGAC